MYSYPFDNALTISSNAELSVGEVCWRRITLDYIAC
jgi:hypothetical protein